MSVGSAELSTHPTEADRAAPVLTPRSATWIGSAATAAVVVVFVALEAPVSQILLAAGLAALWGMLPRFTAARGSDPSLDAPAVEAPAPPAPSPTVPPQAADAAPATRPAVDPTLRLRALGEAAAAGFGACGTSFDEASSTVRRGQSLLHEAVAALVTSFEGLKGEAEAQSRLVIGLVAQLSKTEGGERGVLESFIAETNQAMQDFVEHIVLVSRQSMAMASRVDDITAQMDEIEAVTNRARKLAGNTAMLALNAKIEAAQAGRHAAGFTVIADEVQSLARESQDFNEKISHLVATMRGTVRDTRTAIQDLASKDMNSAVLARQRADSLGSEVERLNEGMRESLQTVSEVALRVDEDLAEAVRALQFEDIVRQTLDHGLAVLDEGKDLVEDTRGAFIERSTEPGVDEALRLRFERHEVALQSLHQTAQQDTLQQGDIELF